MIDIRASRTPLLFLCPGAAQPAATPVSEDSEPAAVGRATHEALRSLAEVGEVRWEELPAIAERHGCELDEVRMLCAFATKLWPALKDSFAGALTEVPFAIRAEEYSLTGHVDLVASAARVARIADWKTGRKDSDYVHQMKAYGTLAFADDPELEQVTVTVIWVRDGDIENYTMKRVDAIAWLETLRSEVVRWDGVYHPGKHCQHCPRSHECNAANALARRYVAALAGRAMNDPAAELALMPAEEIVDIFAKAKFVEAYAKGVREAIKAHVLTKGDVVANGVRLTTSTEERRKLDPALAWAILEDEGFEDQDFADCMELRISRVEKRVAQKAGRGKGAARVRHLNERFEAKRAISREQVVKLVDKRA